ncbi:MAG: hypothetical protein QXJ02_05265 [Candidatus Bathyarchaeia archaeon]
MYTVWIKIDDTLPWVELKGIYPTSKDAKKAAGAFRSTLQMRIVKVAGKGKPVKALATIRA